MKFSLNENIILGTNFHGESNLVTANGENFNCKDISEQILIILGH